MPIPFHRLAAFICILCSGFASAQDNRAHFESWLRENRESFPMVGFGRDKIPFARVHTMPPIKSQLKWKDRYFTGFRFTTPEWHEGHVFWMFGMPGDFSAQPDFHWYIVPEQAQEEEFRLVTSRQGARFYPRFRELFPGCGSMVQQTFDGELLKPSSRYIVWFSYPTPQTRELRFALTVGSKRGIAEFGMLPSGYPDIGPLECFRKSPDLKPVPPKDLLAAGMKTFKEKGIAPALEELDLGLRRNIDAGAPFQDFWVTIWREAQTGSGRSEREWAAALNLWLQERCLEFDATDLAVQLGSNGATSLMNVYRYGSARSTLIPFHGQMERRKLSLDPTSYPDSGPAFASLPDVRMREFPVAGLQGASYVAPNGMIGTRREMPNAFGACMHNLAALELMGGEWRTAIERNLWVRAWAERMREKIFEPEGSWYGSQIGIADALFDLGLLELADAQYETALSHDWPDIYQNRSKLAARGNRISIRLELGQADPRMLEELDEIHKATKENPFCHRRAWEAVEITKAKCLAQLGRDAECNEILKRLADDGSHPARLAILKTQIRSGKIEGVEEELLAILELTRDWGRKLDEAALYSLYADFLTNNGRLPEALAMRREAVRLMRSFDLFVQLPQELARLSVLLSKCGDAPASASSADEATRLGDAKDRLPPRVQAEIAGILKQRAASKPVAAPKSLLVDLQPLNASMVPVKGRPLRGRLTLSNPFAQAVEGTLSFSGLPVDAAWKQASGEATVLLGKTGTNQLANVRVEAGSFAVIDLTSPPDQFAPGELSVIWSSPGQKDQISVWTIEDTEAAVAAAVVDAGVFKRNAFYGVPVHHHYQSPAADDGSAPIRAICSIPARVELYDAENRPVYVDANGNGEFGDPGDVVHQDQDRDGSPDIQLRSGETRMRLQVFPSGDLPSDGLKIALESRFQAKWTPFAEDLLQP
ncbi:hypothetical protein OJ996_02715 [Luteolibacter sp. GHJ8]|uniref:Tetratricopeptide repeat protein n=1 Tax=Luteolibacter rhizosphaerae TaxID=2989719 RepID=A0ABT3FY25_9BACT|nr:hypothetical protein [Luteolibacter rhizosphaerae]MCW1912468.1 hypothetical protein [Luteolibacter rhizosphaerae]